MTTFSYTNERSTRRHTHTHSHREISPEDVDAGHWYFCFGDCASINSYLESRSGWTWTLPKFLNALFRGIGQVVYANNPFSGLLILTSIFWYSMTVGLLVLASTSVSVLIAVLFNFHPKSIISGLVLFNSVLLASVTGSLWTPLYSQPISINIYVFIITGSALSVMISHGLSNILSSFKPSVPILSIPFHILVFITFVCLKPSNDENRNSSSLNNNFTSDQPSVFFKQTFTFPGTESILVWTSVTEVEDFYTWGNLQNTLIGVVLSSGQVFGIADIFTSILIYAAILLYSPILTIMCIHGAVIGTVLGLFLTPFPNDAVFLGVWGFNGFLSSGAVGTFYVFNAYSFLNGTANAVFTTILQYTLTSSFATYNIPVFGLPFILSTILFICVTSNGPQLVRVKALSFPEKQRSSFRKKQPGQTPVTERSLLSA